MNFLLYLSYFKEIQIIIIKLKSLYLKNLIINFILLILFKNQYKF